MVVYLVQLKLLTSRVFGETTNLTYRIEKSLLEQKLADAQQDVIIGDLRLKLVDLRSSASPLSDAWAGSAASREAISSAENGRSRTSNTGSGLLNKLQTPITGESDRSYYTPVMHLTRGCEFYWLANVRQLSWTTNDAFKGVYNDC